MDGLLFVFQLIAAVKNGDLEAVKEAIEGGEDKNGGDKVFSLPCTALIAALPCSQPVLSRSLA